MAIVIAENMADWIKKSLPADQVCEYIGFCDPVDMENGNVADRVRASVACSTASCCMYCTLTIVALHYISFDFCQQRTARLRAHLMCNPFSQCAVAASLDC